jgi:osmotically-inducible protein OsmY
MGFSLSGHRLAPALSADSETDERWSDHETEVKSAMVDIETNPIPEEDRLELLAKVRATLRSEPLLGPSFHLRDLRIEPDGALVLDGEVPSVAAKKLALEHVAAAVPSATCIVDRLHVKPAVHMTDKEIRIHVRNALIADPALRALEIWVVEDGEPQLFRGAPEKPLGRINVEVTDGVVILNGHVPGLTSKRVAGVTAWWVPGVRDVFNGIEVDPPEEDSPELIAEAVRAVLEMDPLVNASQINVGIHGTQVRLTGLVRTEAEAQAAERDAWCVFGVDTVINHIKVEP